MAEVSSQVIFLLDYVESSSPLLAQKIIDRLGYTQNLRKRIHNSCFKETSESLTRGTDSLVIRAFELIATDLERISELCRDSVKQIEPIQNKSNLNLVDYESLLERVIRGIDLIDLAILGNDNKQALKIGLIERKLNQAYKKLFKKYTNQLKRKGDTEDLISLMFVARNIEQMGDALLSISESILSVNVGQPINTK